MSAWKAATLVHCQARNYVAFERDLYPHRVLPFSRNLRFVIYFFPLEIVFLVDRYVTLIIRFLSYLQRSAGCSKPKPTCGVCTCCTPSRAAQCRPCRQGVYNLLRRQSDIIVSHSRERRHRSLLTVRSKIDGCQSSANHWYQTTMSACDFHDMSSALSCKCQYTTLLWE